MCCSRRYHQRKAVLQVLRGSPRLGKTVNNPYRSAWGNGHGGHVASPESQFMLWVENANVSALRDKNLTT